jgi:hypothetical protein
MELLMANTDQGQGSQPFSPTPDSGTPRPDQSPSAAPPGSTPRSDRGAPAPPDFTFRSGEGQAGQDDQAQWTMPGRPPAYIPPARGPRQHYFNPTQDRSASEWGKPGFGLDLINRSDGIPDSPFVPQPHDVNRQVYDISHTLHQIGSRDVSRLAMLMGNHRGAFLKGFMGSQKERMSLELERYKLHAVELEAKQREELQAASEALVGNPNNPNKMWDELRAIADKNGDTHLWNAINSGQVRNVENLLKARDAKTQTLSEINANRAKLEDDQLKRDKEKRQADADEQTRRNRENTMRSYGEDPARLPGGPIGPGAAPRSAAGDGETEESGGGDGGDGGRRSGPDSDNEVPQPTPADPDAPAPGPGAGRGAGAGGAGDPAAYGQASPEERQETGEGATGGGWDQYPGQSQDQGGGMGQAAGGYVPRRVQTDPNLPGGPSGSNQPTRPGQSGGGGGQAGAQPAGTTNERMQHLAHEVLVGHKLDLGSGRGADTVLNNYLSQRAREVADQMRPNLMRIADPNNRAYDQLPADQRQAAVLNDVRRVDPELARDVENYVKGDLIPNAKYRDSEGWKLAFSLANKADPTYTVNTSKTRGKAMAEATPGGTFGRQVRYMNAAVQQINQTIEAIDHLPSWPIRAMTGNMIGSGVADYISPGATKQTGIVKSMIIDAIAETEKAVTNGKPAQTERNRQEEATSIMSQPLEGVKGQIIGRLQTLKNTLDDMKSDYARETGLNPDRMFEGHISPDIQRSLDQINKYRDFSGWGGGSGAPGSRTTTPSRGGANSDAAAREWLRNNPNDPRAAEIRRELGM